MRRLIRDYAHGAALRWIAGLLLSAGCGGHKSDANAENFSRAVTTYLEKSGALCVGREAWPVDVPKRKLDPSSRNALQLPVLERLGVVRSSDEVIDDKAEDGTVSRQEVRRYTLTDSGNRYFLQRGPHGRRDLCAAKLSLDKVVTWELPPVEAKARRQAVVTYTYHVDPFPWTADPQARKVFPAVDRVIEGAGTAQLTETFTLTDEGWVANDLLDPHP
jgi:hypothetical protein